LVLLALAVAPARGGAPWELDGHDWKAMTEPQKLAYLTGVIAGAATARVGALEPDPAVAARAAELRRAGQLLFNYAPNVYKARLEDFYFYADRRSVPIVRALQTIERELRDNATGR
jgi:hypothetical protein